MGGGISSPRVHAVGIGKIACPAAESNRFARPTLCPPVAREVSLIPWRPSIRLQAGFQQETRA